MQNLKLTLPISGNRLLCTIYFFLFCIIDQRVKTASGLDGTFEFFRNFYGILMALLIFCHYKTDDFRRFRKPFTIWAISGAILGIAACILAYLYTLFPLAWFLMILGIYLFGFIIIYTFATVIKEKNYSHINLPMLFTWCFLMLVMILSRSDYWWPFFYFIMFGLFFLTPYTKEEQVDIFQGALNGLILSFFAFQAFCCVFRPYDVVRYVGIYTNSNIAGLYYLEVLAAIMAKYLYAVKTNARLWMKAFYWLSLGVVLSFLFMCIGRTAWIVAAVLCLLFLLALNKLLPKKHFFLNGLALLICTGIMFPCTFGIVRYTPPLFHHPVWFWGEWNEEKVHSWDPWDSDKYIDMDELLSASLGRVIKTVEDLLSQSPWAITAQASDTLDAAEAEHLKKLEENAVLTYEEAENGLLVRKTIYTHYLRNLNLWGHRQDEQGFQLTGRYWIGHAHNIYLQYGTDFGIIAVLVFMDLSVRTCVSLLGRYLKKTDIMSMGYALFALIPLVFGLFEYCWGVSTFSILTLFMAWGGAIRKN